MSPTDITLEALDYIAGDASGSATIAAAKASQLRRIARDLTATMQQIYEEAPALYKDRHGARVADPQSITVTVAEGATTLTTVATLIDGSTILIGGDATYNMVRVTAGTKTLALPYNGLSGTYPAQVWNDAILLGATVERVTGHVLLNEQFRLTKRVNRGDAATSRLREPDYGRWLRTVSNRRQPGQPDSYWVEAMLKVDGASHESRLMMRLFPIPSRSYTVAFDVRLKAPRFSVADLGTDSTPSTVSLIVAADMREAIVRPLFIQRWSGSPWFRNKEALKEIGRQADKALELLKLYRPQQESNRRITAPL